MSASEGGCGDPPTAGILNEILIGLPVERVHGLS
jgi:hypothetical protein